MINRIFDFITDFGENSTNIMKSAVKLLGKFLMSILHGTLRFVTEVLKGILNIIKFIFNPFSRKMKFTAVILILI